MTAPREDAVDHVAAARIADIWGAEPLASMAGAHSTLARAYRDAMRDALTPAQARYLLDGSHFTPDVTDKLRRIAARAATTREATDGR